MGTEEQWNTIVIGKENSNVTSATVNYNVHVHTPGAEATCTTPQVCTVCETVLVQALGHTEVQHDAKTPTETEFGWEAYVTCENCDYTTYVEIPSILTFELVANAYYSIVDCTQNVDSLFIPVTYNELPVACIEYAAFKNCSNLTTVNYDGVDEQWNEIVIEEGNENLTNATIVFNYGELTENNNIVTVLTNEGLAYTAKNYVSLENGIFIINQGFEITFADGLYAEEFNRINFKYKSSEPIKVTYTFTLDGEEKSEYFYLEATKYEFRGLIEGYLADKKGVNLKKITVDTCEEVDGCFILRDLFTETIPLYGDVVYTTTTRDSDGDGTKDTEENRDLFVESDRYKIGVRLSWGGAMTYFEDKNDDDAELGNLVNIHDTGRLIQQSFYGTKGNDEYTPGTSSNTTWPYNPVQGGNKYNEGSTRLIDVELGDDYIYILSQSLDWALDKDTFMTHTYYENTYTINGDHVVVDNVMTDFSGWKHDPGGQEIPAVYLISYFDNLSYYNGTKPWTYDDSGIYYESNLGGWSESVSIPLLRGNTETWSIWINSEDGFGFGTYCPNIQKHIAIRHQYDGSKDPMANSTSYVAPSCSLIMQPYKPITYSYIFATGNPEDIRQIFTENKDFADNASLSEDRIDQLISPNKFEMENIDLTVESNVEIFSAPLNSAVSYSEEENATKITATGKSDPHVSLSYKWNSDRDINTENYNVFEFEYMIPTSNSATSYSVQIFIGSGSNNSLSEACSVSGELIADGNYHTIKLYVDPSKWTGTLNDVRFDYFRLAAIGDVIYLKSFCLKKYDLASIGIENDMTVNGNEMLVFSKNYHTEVSFDKTVGAAKLTVLDSYDVSVGLDFSSLGLSSGDYNTLVVEYMLPTTNSDKAKNSVFFYKLGEDVSYTSEQSVSVSPLTADGDWHTMTVYFANKTNWSENDIIKTIRFDYFESNSVAVGDTMYIRSIKWVKN